MFIARTAHFIGKRRVAHFIGKRRVAHSVQQRSKQGEMGPSVQCIRIRGKRKLG